MFSSLGSSSKMTRKSPKIMIFNRRDRYFGDGLDVQNFLGFKNFCFSDSRTGDGLFIEEVFDCI